MERNEALNKIVDGMEDRGYVAVSEEYAQVFTKGDKNKEGKLAVVAIVVEDKDTDIDIKLKLDNADISYVTEVRREQNG